MSSIPRCRKHKTIPELANSALTNEVYLISAVSRSDHLQLRVSASSPTSLRCRSRTCLFFGSGFSTRSRLPTFHGLMCRPFFLPCLAVSALGLISLLSMTFTWIETQPQIAEAPGGWQMNLLRVLTCQPRKFAAQESGESLGKLGIFRVFLGMAFPSIKAQAIKKSLTAVGICGVHFAA